MKILKIIVEVDNLPNSCKECENSTAQSFVGLTRYCGIGRFTYKVKTEDEHWEKRADECPLVKVGGK